MTARRMQMQQSARQTEGREMKYIIELGCF